MKTMVERVEAFWKTMEEASRTSRSIGSSAIEHLDSDTRLLELVRGYSENFDEVWRRLGGFDYPINYDDYFLSMMNNQVLKENLLEEAMNKDRESTSKQECSGAEDPLGAGDNGKSRVGTSEGTAKIVWNTKKGKGNLVYLFDKLIEHRYVLEGLDGSKTALIAQHFEYSDGSAISAKSLKAMRSAWEFGRPKKNSEEIDGIVDDLSNENQ